MTARNPSKWLANMLGPIDFQVGGVDASVERRGTINLIGATVEDDPDNERTDITIVSGTGTFTAPTGTGFVSVTSGALDAASIKVNLASTTYVTGILPVANGGTGVTSLTLPASGLVVGTTDSQTLTGKTISGASNTLTVRLASDVSGTLPVANGGTGITSLGAGVATFWGTPSGANLASALTSALPVSKGGTGQTALISAMAALAIDWSLAPSFTKTLAAGSNTITFSNQTAGQTIIVRLTGATSTVTWPTVKWPGGTVPTQTSAGTDVYTFFYDGTSTFGSVVQAMA